MRINEVIKNKLLLQAEEARNRGMVKLAEALENGLEEPKDEECTYSAAQLNEDVYQDMWKIALNVVKYYGLESIDAEKLDEAVSLLSNNAARTLEDSLFVNGIGPFEPKLPGERK